MRLFLRAVLGGFERREEDGRKGIELGLGRGRLKWWSWGWELQIGGGSNK